LEGEEQLFLAAVDEHLGSPLEDAARALEESLLL
jgi:hypothetical protein